MPDPAFALSRAHRTRLMQVWRSAGWPCHDVLEIDLLAAGLLAPQARDGRDAVQVTPAGLEALAQARRRQQRTASLHDRVAARFAGQLMAEGRVVWRELSLRAAVPLDAGAVGIVCDIGPGLWEDAPPSARAPQRWRNARPDLYSLRNTTVEAYLQPMVHEVKVSRADLLSDLRHAAKRQAYEALAGACCYVFPHGLAELHELPDAYGVWVLHGDPDAADARFEQLRAPRHTEHRLPFAVWMALAKAAPLQGPEGEPLQPMLMPDEPHAVP
jgi:hypothetical protein